MSSSIWEKMPQANLPEQIKRIIVRGLLPPIMVEATEDEIRKEICEVICSEPDFSDCKNHDFEFIDMSGKQASIPHARQAFRGMVVL